MKPSEKQIDKVDQLFKNKLSDHAIAPSEEAWARVEAGLSKKNLIDPSDRSKRSDRSVMMWHWAAAVLLMGALTAVIYWSQRGGVSDQKLLAKKVTDPTQPNVKSKEAQKPSATLNSDKLKTEINKRDYKPRNTKNNVTPVEKDEVEKAIQHQSSPAKQNFVGTETAQAEQPTEKQNEEKNKLEATTGVAVASTTQKPIKLEFTLDALPSEEIVATTTETKPTGIKKVLNLAREMKQGEGPVYSLREKKDELLAHNFLNRKERNQ